MVLYFFLIFQLNANSCEQMTVTADNLPASMITDVLSIYYFR